MSWVNSVLRQFLPHGSTAQDAPAHIASKKVNSLQGPCGLLLGRRLDLDHGRLEGLQDPGSNVCQEVPAHRVPLGHRHVLENEGDRRSTWRWGPNGEPYGWSLWARGPVGQWGAFRGNGDSPGQELELRATSKRNELIRALSSNSWAVGEHQFLAPQPTGSLSFSLFWLPLDTTYRQRKDNKR